MAVAYPTQILWSPLTEATALSYTSPLFVAIGAVVFLQEKIDWKRGVALFIGFIGVLVILRPGMTGISTGSLLAIIVSIIWAFNNLVIKVQAHHENLAAQTFYNTLFTALLSLPMAFGSWHTPMPHHWFSLLILGLIFLINFFAIFQAYKWVDLVVLIPLDFSRLIFTLILAYFFFGEVITIWTILAERLCLLAQFILHYMKQKQAIYQNHFSANLY